MLTWQDSLLRHDDAFARLLGLIPAKFYLPAEDDAADGAFQKKEKTKAQKKQEAEARKEQSRAAKRAKLDPANTKSAQEVQEERRRAQEAEQDEGADEEMGEVEDDKEAGALGDEASDDEGGDDSMSFAGTSIDALGDQDGEEAPAQEPAPAARPAPTRKASIAELRERLHSKIEALHKKRHPHESTGAAPPNSKQALLEERRRQRGEMRDRRRPERKEARRQAKASGKPAKPAAVTAGAQGSTQQAGLLVADSGAKSRGKDAGNEEVSYGQVSFDSPNVPSTAKKSKYALPSDPKSALAALEARKRKQEAKAKRLAEKHGDEHAGDALDEEERWGKAMAAAGGVRIRDNEQMLKQTLKRREKAKAKSTKAWNDRRKAEQEAQAARQKKRMDNIAARREAKLAKHGKSTGKKPSKARPGFEGTARPLGAHSRGRGARR